MNHENTTVTSSGKTNNIPKDYIYCPAADGACPRIPHCLRAIAYRQLTATEAPTKSGPIRIVHPACVASAADGCEYYRDSTPVRFARGMTKLFDEIPHRLEADIRRRIMACFSCRSYYFQSRKGERLITPKEQQDIANVFRRAGLKAEPEFDNYVEETYW